MKRTAAELNNTIGDKLFKLLDKAFIEARKPEAGWLTLDGVVYELLRRAGNKIEALSKHSPSADSKSGKIINILVQIIDNISILNDDILLNIETEMDNVL